MSPSENTVYASRAVLHPPCSAQRAEQVAIRNRRQIYLDQHPEYFTNKEHEFTNPLLYDKLVRQFLSASEREEGGKVKGYARVLESDLIQSEAKFAQLSSSMDELSCNQHENSRSFWSVGHLELDEKPESKKEAFQMWMSFLTAKFMNGEDDDFDYQTVDENEELDDQARRDAEEKWFDDEEPSFDSHDDDDSGDANYRSNRKQLMGETGILDF